MKTITGKVLSTSPISLSKAASILSKFVSADTGASQAVCAYLRRASVSFSELAQLHKELKSNRKHKTGKSEIIVEDEKPAQSALSIQPLTQAEVREPTHGVIDGGWSQMKKQKKKKKENGGQIVEKNQGQFIEQSYKKKHAKVDKIEIAILEEDKVKMEIEEDGNVGMENERKNHNKKIGIVIVEENTTEKKKKRKSGEIEEGRGVHSVESTIKKKKRKTEEQTS